MRRLEPGDPSQIGKYRLLGVVGTGGMGKVYLGRSDTGRTVAVKVIRPDLSNDESFRARFGQEVSSAQRVSGTFTAKVLDSDLTAPQPWLATSYVAGLSLTEAVARFGRLPDESVIVLANGLAQAIQAIHAAGVIHRDLKPSNVILGIDGPRVIDFGIARAADDSVLTASGQLIGSPSFMSPEQVKGEKVGPACDVFSWAGVVAFAAAGAPPFGEGDMVTVLWRVVQEQPDISQVPAGLRSIVAVCLDKNPANRPTIDELTAQLSELPAPATGSWLPPAILEDVSRRTANLLDLDHETDQTDEETHASSAETKGPTQPPPLPNSVPSPKRSRVQLATVVSLLVVAIAAVAVAVWLATKGSSGNETASDETGDTTQVGGLPTAFEGQWTGRVSGSDGEYIIVSYFYWGGIGDTVGETKYTQPNGDVCVRSEDLTAVDGPTAQLQARLSDGPASCLEGPLTSTIKLQGGSTIEFVTTGPSGSITGTLQRQQ